MDELLIFNYIYSGKIAVMKRKVFEDTLSFPSKSRRLVRFSCFIYLKSLVISSQFEFVLVIINKIDSLRLWSCCFTFKDGEFLQVSIEEPRNVENVNGLETERALVGYSPTNTPF